MVLARPLRKHLACWSRMGGANRRARQPMAALEPETSPDLTPVRLHGRLYAASSRGVLVPADVLGASTAARSRRRVGEAVSEAAAHAVKLNALMTAIKHVLDLVGGSLRQL
jgi:hypothetical protein